jgi:two-component system, NarL family, sensor histidine kinase UhpB
VGLVAQAPHELAVITERFNALAHALDAARTENAELANRLITAQDDERRRTALELHDEVGPCLFGLKAYATSIAALADKLPDTQAQDLRERAREMMTILERLQLLNRSLLKRLRPMALGHIPLRDLLAEVVADRERQHPQLAFAFSTGTLQQSYGDAIDLTIYRCVQEGLSNAIRHANGTSVAVDLGETNGRDTPSIRLVVRDDGAGIAPDAPAGFGLAGMQERVRALGGHCVIDDAEVRGTSVRVMIPLQARA